MIYKIYKATMYTNIQKDIQLPLENVQKILYNLNLTLSTFFGNLNKLLCVVCLCSLV